EAGILSQGAVNVTVNYPNGTVTNMSLTNSSGGAGSCTVGGNVWGRSILAGSTTGNITINKTWASDRPFTGSNLGVQNANLNVTVTEMLSYSFVLQEVGEGECANGLIVGDSTEPPGSPESGAIEFIYVASGASGTQTDIEPCFKDVACCQNSGSSIPIFTMSNTGNAVIDWKLSFNSTLPSWASVRCGKSEDSGSAFDVSTSAVSIVAIPVSGIENLYCWADFNAAPAGGSSRLLIHNSTA
ncbi:hypothetical protein HUU53_03895, partial [Candidatus Micrarchaeota archaeon]|nr:hypothetical protein [Candidatus Micrarchaeota archaeon]